MARFAAVLLTVAMAAQPATAVASSIWAEVGDAGQLTSTAQVPVGSGPLTTITGELSFFDVDVFEIVVTGGGNFSATASGASPLFLNPELFLFDSQGLGVYANDDAFPPGGSPGEALLPANNALTPIAPGIYFLAVSTFFLEPVSSSGAIFPCVGCNPTAVVGPTGPGGGSSLTGWSGFPFYAGSYTLTLTGAEVPSQTSTVPEPATVSLLGLGLASIGARRWRQRNA